MNASGLPPVICAIVLLQEHHEQTASNTELDETRAMEVDDVRAALATDRHDPTYSPYRVARGDFIGLGGGWIRR